MQVSASSRPSRASAGAAAVGSGPFRILGLDGLRAIAVLAVLAFHVSPHLLPGGFIGVDVFFVVSGFLITTLLIRERARTGRIDLGQFWVRRARRLLPALILVIVVSIAASLLGPADLRVGILRQTLGALTFSTNWVEIAHGASYFEHTSPVLFMNFWSLAVEEQFYLVWPLLFLVLVTRVRNRRLRIALPAAAAAVSAGLMAALYTSGQDATRVYYGTDTHAFGLLLGISLAFAWEAGASLPLDDRSGRRLRRISLLAGLAVLALCLATVSDSSAATYRGGLLLASLATLAIILSQLGRTAPLSPVLESAPVRWIGQRSYGIYLWHWPALKILNALMPAAPQTAGWWLVQLLAVALTLGLAAASFTWLETPVRRLGFRGTTAHLRDALLRSPRRLPAIAGTTAAGLLVIAALAGIVTVPEKSSVQAAVEANEQIQKDSQAKAKEKARAKSSASATPSPSPAKSRRAFDYPAADAVTFIGDSIVSTSAQGIADRFPGSLIDGVPNRKWDEAEGLVKGHLAAGTLGNAVVIDFGTNGGVPDPGAVKRTLDAVGPDRAVVLMTIYGQSTFIDAANELYRKEAAGRPNVIIGEWHKAVSARPGILQADGTHPDIPGVYVYGDVVKQAFHDLARRSGGKIPPGH